MHRAENSSTFRIFSQIFGCKPFAGSRAEKARGCFSSYLVSKKVLFLNGSFSLGVFQLSTVEQQIIFANISAQETFSLSFATRTFEAEEQSKNHKLTYFSYPERFGRF